MALSPWTRRVIHHGLRLPPERGFGTRDSPIHRSNSNRRGHAQVPRIRSRIGAMDGLGLRTFDSAAFQDMLEQLIGHQPDQNHQRPYSSAQIDSCRHMTSPHQIHSPSHEEPDHFFFIFFLFSIPFECALGCITLCGTFTTHALSILVNSCLDVLLDNKTPPHAPKGMASRMT
jgi:hypothetical protein